MRLPQHAAAACRSGSQQGVARHRVVWTCRSGWGRAASQGFPGVEGLGTVRLGKSRGGSANFQNMLNGGGNGNIQGQSFKGDRSHATGHYRPSAMKGLATAKRVARIALSWRRKRNGARPHCQTAPMTAVSGYRWHEGRLWPAIRPQVADLYDFCRSYVSRRCWRVYSFFDQR